MDPVYVLTVESTGEEILRETVPSASLATWQKRTEGKILRRRNRAQRFRTAIKEKDTIAGWANFDEMKANGILEEELQLLSSRIFRNYDRYYNERLGSKWNARVD